MLSDLNRDLLQLMCSILGIETRISSSSDYRLAGDRTAMLIGVCEQAGATEYLTGPAAKEYLDEDAFAAHGVEVTYLDYSGYPEYPQLWGGFEHAVSIVDLLFNVGPDAAPTYMKSFG